MNSKKQQIIMAVGELLSLYNSHEVVIENLFYKKDYLINNLLNVKSLSNPVQVIVNSKNDIWEIINPDQELLSISESAEMLKGDDENCSLTMEQRLTIKRINLVVILNKKAPM